MQPASDIQLAQATWVTCKSLLPPALIANLTFHSSDPAPFKKKGTDIMRLRILPKNRQPPNFWNSTWCFYEIGVGSYERGPNEGLNLGAVSFVQFSDNEKCGGGIYRNRVLRILNQLAFQRKNDFQVQDEKSIILYRRYSISHRLFPHTLAGQDLAWLITESLPLFASL
ncbi:MAG: hypothetical protein JWQ71_5026 [Pedosphaera sp.]|nr:hypothetical protein [Pedosphaera sp.]